MKATPATDGEALLNQAMRRFAEILVAQWEEDHGLPTQHFQDHPVPSAEESDKTTSSS